MAVLALVGAATIIVGAEIHRGLVTSLGAAVLVIDAVLLALLMRSLRANRVQVEFDAHGYRVAQRSGTHEGTWAEVTKVTQAPGRLTFYVGDEERFHLIAPYAQDDLEAMAREAAQLLDANRGYGAPLA